MKAIETKYRGYRFRSRQEARWAVFFDTLKLPWEYEVEGFHLPSGNYLPDFWLPTLDCYFEVKGGEPTQADLTKALELSDLSKKLVAVASGQMKTDLLQTPGAHIEWPVSGFNIQVFAGDVSSTWRCKSYDFSMWNWTMDTDLPSFINRMHPNLDLPQYDIGSRRKILAQHDRDYYWKKYNEEHPRYIYGRSENPVYFITDPVKKLRFSLEPEPEPSEVSRAFMAARSARFEFGE